MNGLFACGVSAAIHKLLQDKGIACPHCRDINATAGAEQDESSAPQNRHLIAAAPDLLAAAIKAERFVRSMTEAFYGEGLEVANYHRNGDLEPFDNLIDGELDGDELALLRAAIAKATGQEVA